MREHFFDQVLEDILLVSAQPLETSRTLCSSIERENCQLQPGYPALGLFFQEREISFFQMSIVLTLEKRCYFCVCEAQIFQMQLNQFLLQAQASERQRRYATRCQHKVHGW